MHSAHTFLVQSVDFFLSFLHIDITSFCSIQQKTETHFYDEEKNCDLD